MPHAAAAERAAAAACAGTFFAPRGEIVEQARPSASLQTHV
jgi:hypothetical protein